MKKSFSLLILLAFFTCYNASARAEDRDLGTQNKKYEAFYALDYKFKKNVFDLAKHGLFTKAKDEIINRKKLNPNEEKGLSEFEQIMDELEKEPSSENRNVQIEALSQISDLVTQVTQTTEDVKKTLDKISALNPKLEKFSEELQKDAEDLKKTKEYFLACQGKYKVLDAQSRENCINKGSLVLDRKVPELDSFHSRVSALAILKEFLPESKKVFPVILLTLEDKVGLPRYRAAELIAEMNPEPLSHILPFLNSTNPEVRASATYALSKATSKDAIQQLKKMLGDPEIKVAFDAALTLRKINTTETNSIVSKFIITDKNKFLLSLDSSDEKSRDTAAIAVGEFKIYEAIPKLIKLLSSRNFNAQSSLSKLAPNSIQPLIQALETSDDKLKESAASALGFIKPTTPEIISSLEKAHSNEASIGTKISIRTTLHMIGTKEALEAEARVTKQSLF